MILPRALLIFLLHLLLLHLPEFAVSLCKQRQRYRCHRGIGGRAGPQQAVHAEAAREQDDQRRKEDDLPRRRYHYAAGRLALRGEESAYRALQAVHAYTHEKYTEQTLSKGKIRL